jgi:2-polyprenyl-6-methoxyphenol hydroxylase-like FAD-dependent oxidoreductase
MAETIHTRCCIAGGGPAGMMLGFLLARMGVDVLVLEKHADFLRDFRGDTIHPSTLELMYELGLLDEFLKRPHQEVRELAGQIGDETVRLRISPISQRTVASSGSCPNGTFSTSSRSTPGAIPRFS